jgi:hypothetical protein
MSWIRYPPSAYYFCKNKERVKLAQRATIAAGNAWPGNRWWATAPRPRHGTCWCNNSTTSFRWDPGTAGGPRRHVLIMGPAGVTTPPRPSGGTRWWDHDSRWYRSQTINDDLVLLLYDDPFISSLFFVPKLRHLLLMTNLNISS